MFKKENLINNLQKITYNKIISIIIIFFFYLFNKNKYYNKKIKK